MLGLTSEINKNKKDIHKLKNSNHPNKDVLVKHKITRNCMLKDDLAKEKINKWLSK